MAISQVDSRELRTRNKRSRRKARTAVYALLPVTEKLSKRIRIDEIKEKVLILSELLSIWRVNPIRDDHDQLAIYRRMDPRDKVQKVLSNLSNPVLFNQG